MKATLHNGGDLVLLRKFSETGNQAAFHSLVERYTGLVYGVALRRTGDAHLSEEIAQNVFLILARKAESLVRQRSLGAWLHRTTVLESLAYLRQEANRHRYLSMIREQQQQHSEGEEASWRAIRPYLDQLLNRLSERDQEILILHYIEGLQFSEVGQRVGMTPAAAQKRSVRALGKISEYLKRYGVVASTVFLSKGLQAELVFPVPAGLVAQIGGTSLTMSSAVTTSAFPTILTTMTTSKLAFAVTFLVSAFTPTFLMSLGSEPDKKVFRKAVRAPVHSARPEPARSGGLSFDKDEFHRLLQKLEEDEYLFDERTRALQRLMLTLDLDEVKEAITILDEVLSSCEDLNDRFKWVLASIAQAAYSRWAEIEPEAAVASAYEEKEKGKWGYYAIIGAWKTWAFDDWEAAFAWEIDYHDSFHLWGFLDSLAEVDGLLALERASDLAAVFPKDGDAYMKRVLGSWGRYEPQQAIEWMDENFVEPVKRDELIGDALEGLGEYHPEQALEQMGLIANEVRVREVRYNIFWTWSLLQPKEAGDYFEQAGGGEFWDESTVRSAGEAISRNQPVHALEIAKTIQNEKGRDMFYCGILCGTTESELGQVLEAANEIGMDGIRINGSLNRFLDEWAGRDQEAAEAWVESLPAGPKKEWARHFFPKGGQS